MSNVSADQSPIEGPSSQAPGDRSAPPDAALAGTIAALAALLAEVVQLAGQRAVYPGRWSHLAELAIQHPSVRAALAVESDS